MIATILNFDYLHLALTPLVTAICAAISTSVYFTVTAIRFRQSARTTPSEWKLLRDAVRIGDLPPRVLLAYPICEAGGRVAGWVRSLTHPSPQMRLNFVVFEELTVLGTVAALWLQFISFRAEVPFPLLWSVIGVLVALYTTGHLWVYGLRTGLFHFSLAAVPFVPVPLALWAAASQIGWSL